MRRSWTGFGVLAVGLGNSVFAFEEPPSLEAPRATSEPATPAPTPSPVPAPTPVSAAVLAVPGLMNVQPVARPVSPAPAGPVLMLESPVEPTARIVETPYPSTADAPGGLRLDGPVALDPLPEPDRQFGPPPGERDPSARPERARSVPEPESPPPSSSPRRFGLFGRNRPAPPPVLRRESNRPDAPRDPEADAKLKRQIERQVEAVVGRRVDRVNVYVEGKHVHIRAKAEFFLLKRGIRREIEDLPILKPYHATVDVE